MRVKRQRVLCNDTGAEEPVTARITLNQDHQRIAPLGWPLAASNPLLRTLPRPLLPQPVHTWLDTGADGPDGGTPLHLPARARRALRTVFGTCPFASPRLEHGDGTRRQPVSLRP